MKIRINPKDYNDSKPTVMEYFRKYGHRRALEVGIGMDLPVVVIFKWFHEVEPVWDQKIQGIIDFYDYEIME